MSTYYISVDSDGKIPVMGPAPLKTHYIKYVNDVPVEGKLTDNCDRIWDYKKEDMFARTAGVPSYTGGTLPVIKNFREI